MKPKYVFVALAMIGPVARGGTVTFDPPLAEVDPAASATVDFAVSVQAEGLGQFDSVDLFFQAEDVTLPVFAYSDEFLQAILFPGSTVLCILPPCSFIGGLLSQPTETILVGTLTLHVDQLSVGNYVIKVDSEQDGGLSSIGLFGELEPVFGSATIRVVPEPGMLMLMALATAAVIARRRRDGEGRWN